MTPLNKAVGIIRHLGPGFVAQRAWLAARKRLGVDRRTYRPRPWESIRLEEITRPGTPTEPGAYAEFKRAQRVPFLFELGRPPELPQHVLDAPGERRPDLAERIELLAADRCVYFFHKPSPTPIDWYVNPFAGTRAPRDPLWCDIPDCAASQGDARTLWEPARAAWAIDLARAFARGHAGDLAALFYRWLDSWYVACPPFRGFQWKCGQEAAVRLIALSLAQWTFADSPAATPQRWLQFARIAWATGYRIAHHIRYAISQKNNHAISEAVGLMLVGTLLPELRASSAWLRLGRRVLERELARQIYADGSYVQHSVNYHRVMLHGALLGLRLAELAGQPFERPLYERLARAGDFLYQLSDPATGRLPNYGNNDGACVLPLSECDFADYRPIIQATHYLCHRRRRLSAGPWDEDLLWLFGPEALDSPAEPPRRPESRAFDAGGYYTLRRRDSWAMIRCHTYRDRQSQCDTHHVDFWWRGINILQDCGTYQYYIPGRPDLERYFKSTAAHNVCRIDEGDPAELVSRFLWLPWSCARRLAYQADGAVLLFEGQQDDYDRPPWNVLLRRAVLSISEHAWLIVDDVLADAPHTATLLLHLADHPCRIDPHGPAASLHTPAGVVHLTFAARGAEPRRFELLRGRDGAGQVQGLAAPYYGSYHAVPTLEIDYDVAGDVRLISTIGLDAPVSLTPGGCDQRLDTWRLHTADCDYTLHLRPPGRRVRRIFERLLPQ